MPLPKNFPESPHEVLAPEARWSPDVSQKGELRFPPLVEKIRAEVKAWRDEDYKGASETSRSLLRWWFYEQHFADSGEGEEFHYYFAQREAVESIIYLYEVRAVKDAHDLMRFDTRGELKAKFFDEDWLRFVVKMATGSGKTKVLSLVLAWCYFHKRYEADSRLARNFLVIAPNIIVFDRLKKDFDGLRIFYGDPVLPDNGYDGKNWRNDFNLTVHLQDQMRGVRPTGNLFLTNIHRVYCSVDTPPSAEDEDTRDYFLGAKPSGATTDSKTDLRMILRGIDELVVFNDEAHHVHNPQLAWFKAIQDIHYHLKQKGGALALQVDTSATPKHDNGAIFVQTVADYPLVEAIAQNVVKHPVLPDEESCNKLQERQSSRFSQRYADYIRLGVQEWRKADKRHREMGKNAILFVMTDDTKNCDEVAEYLENTYAELKDAVLVIHTKRNGEISEADSGKSKGELDALRKEANAIDEPANRYKAIVSVLVLKEGWDVRNVTTIVGLRAYTSQSKILPEQTLGRGLRRMYPDTTTREKLSVIGTDAFMKFVNEIQQEGVELEREKMGGDGDGEDDEPFVVEVNGELDAKTIAKLDIAFPRLSPRIYRNYEALKDLDVKEFTHTKRAYRQLDNGEGGTEITFEYFVGKEESHKTTLENEHMLDYHMVLGFFSQVVVKELRLVSAYDVIYGKMKEFIRDVFFTKPVKLDDRNTLLNLAEEETTKLVVDAFKDAVNQVILQDVGKSVLEEMMRVRDMRPFRAKQQAFFAPTKCLFNKIIGDSGFELKFAQFLEECKDVVCYARNYSAVGFKLEYVNASGDFANYIADFWVKTKEGVYVVEIKGREELDLPQKMQRLKQWCEEASEADKGTRYGFVYVDQASFDGQKFKSFAGVVGAFGKYQ